MTAPEDAPTPRDESRVGRVDPTEEDLVAAVLDWADAGDDHEATTESGEGDGTDSSAASVAAVTVDLDGTLVDYRRSPGAMLDRAFERVGVAPLFPVEAYYDRFAEFADRTDSMAELRRACFATLAADRGHDPALGREVAAAFADERDHGNVAWCPGARRLVDTLAERGVPTAVVTNGPPDAQRQKLSAVGLDERVATVVFAGHDCPAKPSPEPVERALAALDCDPTRAVHVGDSENDTASALAAGARAVHVER